MQTYDRLDSALLSLLSSYRSFFSLAFVIEHLSRMLYGVFLGDAR